VLVGIHVLGASLVLSAVLWFHHGLADHRPEPADGADRGGAGGGSERGGLTRPGGGGPVDDDGELVEEAEPWSDPVESPQRETV
jgi:hypothetical protein